MANARYERARARARLALIAPTVDDVTAAYFDGQVEKVLLEAKQRGERSDRELISTLLDAVARKYFSLGLREGDPERGGPMRSKAFAFVTVNPSFLGEPTCGDVVLPRDGNSEDFPDGGGDGRVKLAAVGVVPK